MAFTLPFFVFVLPSSFSWFVVLFQGHLSPLTAAFSGGFFGLFCPVLLLGVLALRRAPISSNWFFIWHSLGPSSTQLLVHNHSGFCSHRYLAGLIFIYIFFPEYFFLQIVLQSPTLLFF